MVKYPKPRLERKEKQINNTDTEAKKYQNIVESHPIEAIVITQREKRKQEKEDQKVSPDKKLEQQGLMARIKGMIFDW